MGMIISAYRQPGGIQIHEDNGDGTMLARFVEEGAADWFAALAALPPEDQVVEPVSPPPLGAVKVAALAGLKRVIAEVQCRYITDLPAMPSIYAEKEKEAIGYLATQPADLTDYFFLQREIGITAPTAYELAQLWLNLAILWKPIAAEIEGIRAAAVNAIETAVDSAGVSAAMQDALDALSGL